MVGRKEGARRHFPEKSLVESRPAASFPSTGILVSPLNWSGKGRGKKKTIVSLKHRALLSYLLVQKLLVGEKRRNK